MERIDCSNPPPSPSSAMDWDQTYSFNEKPIIVGEDDHPACDPTLFPPCIPYFTPEANAGEMSGRSVIGPTVGRGGYIPSPYSERPAKRARDATATEEGLRPSVKRSRGAITEHGTLEVQELIAGCAGDITITGEGPGPSAKCSRGVMTEENMFSQGKIVECARDIVITAVKYTEITTGKTPLDNGSLKTLIAGCAIEIATTAVKYSVTITNENLLNKTLLESIARCTGDVTTAGEDSGLSAKCSRGGMTVDMFLQQRIAECARDIVTTAARYSETTTGEKLLDKGFLQTLIIECAKEITATAVNYSMAIFSVIFHH